MIEFEYCDFNEIKRKKSFHSIAEILKKWWDEDDIELPDREDTVLSFYIDGVKYCHLEHSGI